MERFAGASMNWCSGAEYAWDRDHGFTENYHIAYSKGATM